MIKPIPFLLLSTTLLIQSAWAQAEATVLRLHHFLPSQAAVPSQVLEPWAKKIESESNGRLKVELYPSMQLGGRPSDLMDQVKDGVVDISWSLFGYNPGRYPRTEVFELPFMVTTATSTSMAFQEYFEQHMTKDVPGVQMLAVHTHGPGVLHTREKPIKQLEDMKGLKLRGTSRVVNSMLSSLGASPLGMPVPAVPEALSKGVIDGTVIPFEVIPSLKIPELAPHHTEFSGKFGLYTGTFFFAMNKDTYRSLPKDLQKVIDNNSGMALARWFGEVMDMGDQHGRSLADKAGNETIKLDAKETERWRKVSDDVSADWMKEMDKKGLKGTELVESAKSLIKKYDAQLSSATDMSK